MFKVCVCVCVCVFVYARAHALRILGDYAAIISNRLYMACVSPFVRFTRQLKSSFKILI